MSDLERRIPPLSTLVVFEAAVRLQSFSRAADHCALSQASVSRQMRQLEADIGLRLFDRHRYDVTATDAGERLYKTVSRALEELANTASELRDSADGSSSFTIYSDLSIGSSTLAPLVGRFQTVFPGVKFNILSSYDPIEQTRSPFDIGFQVGSRAENLFDVEVIADDLVFPVCSPQFAKKFSSTVSAEDLSQLPLLHLEYDSVQCIGWKRFLSDYAMKQKKPAEGLVFSSYQVTLDVAENGEGVALGWRRSVSSRIAEGKLVRITDLSLHVPDGIAVYRRRNSELHPLANQVIDIVRENITNYGN